MQNQTKRKTIVRVTLTALRVLLLAAALFLSGYSLYHAQSSPYFDLTEIHYQGILHTDRETLDGLIRNAFPRNILLLELDRVRSLVESESWVKTARIRRKLPGQLFIYITEREPAAVATIDNELYLVDAEGVVLDRYGPRYEAIDKPIVKGLKNVARENAREDNRARMAVYLRVLADLNSPPKDYSQSVSEINVEDPERVAVIPAEDPVPVYLGNQKFLRRYQIFLSKKDLYRQLKEEYGVIESVDVSYEKKIIFHTPQGKGETVIGEKEVVASRN